MNVDPDLVRLLKRLKLGQLVPTLPERLALARGQRLDYAAFLTLLLADEVQRREQQALERHLDQAGFEERATLDAFDWSSPVHLDRQQLQGQRDAGHLGHPGAGRRRLGHQRCRDRTGHPERPP